MTDTRKLPRNAAWLVHVVGDPTLGGTAKAAAAALCLLYMKWDTLANARPGAARLAADLGVSQSTAKRAVRDLVAAGHLVQTHKGGTRRGMRVASSYKGVFKAYRMRPTDAPQGPQ